MWCRICHEHDCGIDHGDNRKARRIVKKSPKKTTLPEGVGRSIKNSPKPKKKKPVQLRLF